MTNLHEGTWAFPSTIGAVKELEILMAAPLTAKRAKRELYHIFGTDNLFDELGDDPSDDVHDVRATVKRELKRNVKLIDSGKFYGRKIDDDVLTRLRKLTEARTHIIRNPDIKPRGAPEEPARAFDRPGKDRSVEKTLKAREYYTAVEFADEGDHVMVLVLSSSNDRNYHGVNVLFYPDGTVDASTGDKLAASQWKNDKSEIIKIAKAALKDETLPGIYHGLGDHSHLRGKGKLSFDIKESKITFKEFLSEKKSIDQWMLISPSGNVTSSGYDTEALALAAIARKERPEGWTARLGSTLHEETVEYGYIGFFNGKQTDIFATSKYAALEKARAFFKAPKSKVHMVHVELAEKDGKPVIHTAA